MGAVSSHRRRVWCMLREPGQPWHQKYKPIRSVREYARGTLFRFFEKVLATDDGKRIAADALRGLVRSPLNGFRESPPSNGSPYPELGTAAEERRDTAAGPVFITARFRSGST